MSAPHRAAVAAFRQRGFWVPGDVTRTEFGTYQRGPMWVEWIAPETVTRPHPLVLVHGGGGQGTDWLTTPDGRPGWAYRFAAEGFAVYVVDRPGHGRSPHHPLVLGEPGMQGPVEMTIGVFAHPDAADSQTQWPWGRTPESPEIAQLAASSGFLLADFAAAQELDAARLTRLLGRIGPAIVITHSAGAPAGWLSADWQPTSVRAIVAVEPLGPPFVGVPGLGSLDWGLTSIPLTTAPAYTDAIDFSTATDWTVPSLHDLPILVVTGSASPFAGSALQTIEFLTRAGANVTGLPLAERGITGNGHGLIFEANSDETVAPVIEWISELA